jgi:hypothetical protein
LLAKALRHQAWSSAPEPTKLSTRASESAGGPRGPGFSMAEGQSCTQLSCQPQRALHAGQGATKYVERGEGSTGGERQTCRPPGLLPSSWREATSPFRVCRAGCCKACCDTASAVLGWVQGASEEGGGPGDLRFIRRKTGRDWRSSIQARQSLQGPSSVLEKPL